MKIQRILPLLVIVSHFSAAAWAGVTGMTDEDREHLLVHFEMTGQVLADLAVAEPDYWRDLMKSVKAPPDMKGKKSSNTDADILWYGIDRVVHTKTGGGHEKVDTYKDLGEALAKFQALRATMIEYIKSTHDDLRAHSFGTRDPIDCWQWMLEISTHAERHIQQIREIKADPNFPKN
jgi:hypothetical protein